MATLDRRGVVVSATDPAQASDPNPGLAIKVAVATSTTADILLSGLQTVDGVVLGEGDRVLVKDQTDPTQNGIYGASSGNWLRTPDADRTSDFAPGMRVEVMGGTLNGGKAYKLTSASPVVIGTSAITWAVVTYPNSAIEWQFGGDASGGAIILPGLGPALEVPFQCTIVRARLSADRVGSFQVDLWKTAFGVVPSSANSICAADLPALANAQFFEDVTLTGWGLSLNAGDMLTPNIVSSSIVRLVTVSLLVSRFN